MSPLAKKLFAIASLILILVFFFPIWKIALTAPQYPEGIGLKIWIDQISGDQKHHLQLINGLNHYIGMKEIHPASIKELRIMPFIIAAMIIFGLVVAWMASRKLAITWLVIFMILGAVGLADFYKWGYDYGHELDPNAPIKVPGMTYQPPLIGSKKLLNITATSYPHIGAWIIFLSIGIGFAAIYYDRRFVQSRKVTSHE